MEKKLEDYLHLYLGCDMWEEYNNEIGKFVGITEEGYLKIRHKSAWTFVPKECRLVLRPLSDMTEEEAWEGWRFVTDPHFGHVSNPKHALRYGGFGVSIEEHANVTKYLLSKHFDLFGLIDSGLALDKTKHPQGTI